MAMFPKLPQPVVPAEVFVAPAVLDAARGRAAVETAVTEGFLRPFDSKHAASLDAPALLYVPFWRVEVSVDGFHIGLSTVSSGRRTLPLPTGGARHKDGIVMIAARTLFPYEPKLPSFFGKLSGVAPLEIGANELVPRSTAEPTLAQGEVLDADVEKERAEKIASGMLLRAVNPTNAIYASYTPQVRSSAFCLYPVYYARYRYEGEARRHAGEDFFVAVSARTGDVVSAKHPSAVRAVAAKVRRLFSLDRR